MTIREVTPAMIDAGVEALREMGVLDRMGPFTAQAVAEAVFSAMQSVPQDSPPDVYDARDEEIRKCIRTGG